MDVIAVLVLLLSLVGLVECLHQLGRLLFHQRRTTKTILMVPASGTPPSLEFVLRDLQHDRLWEADPSQEICIVDLGLSAEALQMIHLLQKDMEGILVCSVEELPRILSSQTA